MNITTLHTLDTEYSADTIEWCSHPEYLSYFVCGTYQLESDNVDSTAAPCRRKGRIYLYKFDVLTKKITELHRQETAAILDMKWLPQVQDAAYKPTLATANALGRIEIYELEMDKLVLLSGLDLNPADNNLLALSLDCKWLAAEQVFNIAASDSKGYINLLSFNLAKELVKMHSWSAHNFEAWICAFDRWDQNKIYTGGDDTFLHAYDLRSYERQFINKSHIAGVTCLLSHPKHENILLTGSYDERLRIFDTRHMKQPLGELNLNGGIWRLKADPLERNLILTACMYKNFSIVQLEANQLDNPKLVGVYEEHESICYGADWCLDVRQCDEELYMATCSFYDHKLCIANVRENQSD